MEQEESFLWFECVRAPLSLWPECPHSDVLQSLNEVLPSATFAWTQSIAPSRIRSATAASTQSASFPVHCTLPPICGKALDDVGLPLRVQERREIIFSSLSLSLTVNTVSAAGLGSSVGIWSSRSALYLSSRFSL